MAVWSKSLHLQLLVAGEWKEAKELPLSWPAALTTRPDQAAMQVGQTFID
jgi:hypothetical protein